jgi:Cys-rich protein (TIGR01571 family)
MYGSSGYATQTNTIPSQSVNSSYTAAIVVQTQLENNWSSSLVSCFDDCGVCMYGLFCLGCLEAENRARMEGRSMDCGEYCLGTLLCCCLYGFGIWCCSSIVEYDARVSVREKFLFPEEGFSDFCASLFCFCCSACQVARELAFREKVHHLATSNMLPAAYPAAYPYGYASSSPAPPPPNYMVTQPMYVSQPVHQPQYYGYPQPQPQPQHQPQYYAASHYPQPQPQPQYAPQSQPRFQ